MDGAAGRLGVGLVGSGFNAGFHLQAFRAVRDADVRGVWSPNPERAAAAAARARALDVGEAKPYASISDMVADPAIDALWLSGPNHKRVENIEEIVHAIERGRGTLARHRVREAACAHGRRSPADHASSCAAPGSHTGTWRINSSLRRYRPDARSCGPAVRRRPAGRISRAPPRSTAGRMRRGSGSGDLQGGGVLNDMMCHSALLVRHLLTRPGRAARPRAPGAGHRAHRQPQVVASRTTRNNLPGPMVRGGLCASPSEDFASLTIEFETDDGHTVIGEATTSWSFVGAGLRLSAELLGPEYSMSWNSLEAGSGYSFRARCRDRRAKTSSRSRTPKPG